MNIPIFSKKNCYQHVVFIGQKGIPAEFPGTSGVEFYVERHALQLIHVRKMVDCYVRNWATPKNMTSYQGIRLIHIPTINTKHLDAPIHCLLSSIHASCGKADMVWYQASGPALFSFIPKLFGKKIIVTIHTLEWKRDKWGKFSRFILRIGERIGVLVADEVVVVSDEIAKYIRQKYGIIPTIDTPPTINTKRVVPDIITKKYHLSGNDYILYLGRFVPEKRIEWLIRAFQNIRPSEMRLVLAGGASHTDAYERRLRQEILDDPFLADHTIFTSWVFGEEKRELLSNCRLFVLPSSVEGNPFVLQEIPKNTPCLFGSHLSINTPGRVVLYKEDSYDSFVASFRSLVPSGSVSMGA